MQTAIRILALAMLSIAISSCVGGGSNSGASSYDPVLRQQASQISNYDRNDSFRKGDQIRVELNGVPSQDVGIFDTKVDESGNISLPHIGSMRAEGLTSVALKEKIETMYKVGGYFTNPNVTVTSQQARFVAVTGEVRSPQRIYHAKDLTALGAIATCGGFTDYSNRRSVRLLRGGQVITFNAIDIIKDPAQDIPLLPDDKIQVDRSVF